MEKSYQNEPLTTVDGVKIDFVNSWVHLRKSNTEPIIRIYTEAPTQQAQADTLAERFISELKSLYLNGNYSLRCFQRLWVHK